MKRDIRVCCADFVVPGELFESPTAALIWEALPIEGEANLWGEEIYFSIPVEAELDDTAKDVVQEGDIGYWPPGRALCIFFGLTPISHAGEIRPASPVNIIGRVRGDSRVFRGVAQGTTVRLEK